MMQPDTTQLVHDEQCERLVIGTILGTGSIYEHVAETLDDECFYDGKMLGIWQAMSVVRNSGEGIDIITVSAELAKEGSTIQPFDVIDVSQCGLVSTVDIDTYTSRLKTLSLRRRLWRLGQKLVSSGVAETEDVEEVQRIASDELNGLFEKTEGVFTLSDAIVKLLDIINCNMSKGRITGTRTGFRKLDEKGGLHDSDFIVIAGETSNGKTALALSILKNVIESGETVAMYSMEMTKEQLASRIVAMGSNIAANRIMYDGNLYPEELNQVDKAIGAINGNNMFIDEKSTISLDSILLSIRSMKLKYNIRGAVVDYLQILNVNHKGGNFSREQLMGDAARRLKNIAKELGIWVIALSQLSRNQQDPVPSLSRLRDSGQIGEAADVVMLIYRPELYNRTFPYPFDSMSDDECRGKAMIDVAKGRNIGVFKFIVDFDGPTTKFSDLETEEPIYDYGPVEEFAPF